MPVAQETTIEERDGHVWVEKKGEEPSGRCELCEAARDVTTVCDKRIQVLEWMLRKGGFSWFALHELEDDVAKYNDVTTSGSIVCCADGVVSGGGHISCKLNVTVVAHQHKTLVERRAADKGSRS